MDSSMWCVNPVTDLDVIYLLVTHHLKEMGSSGWNCMGNWVYSSLRGDQDVNAQNKDCPDIRSAQQSKQSYSCPIWSAFLKTTIIDTVEIQKDYHHHWL